MQEYKFLFSICFGSQDIPGIDFFFCLAFETAKTGFLQQTDRGTVSFINKGIQRISRPHCPDIFQNGGERLICIPLSPISGVQHVADKELLLLAIEINPPDQCPIPF